MPGAPAPERLQGPPLEPLPNPSVELPDVCASRAFSFVGRKAYRIVGLRSRPRWTLRRGIRRSVAMTHRHTHVLDLYTRHPISAEQIIAKVRASRGHLENLTPEDLYPHDQDHYGGLTANNALADRAEIRAGDRVADFCAGLGGPARYWAHRLGADFVGIDLNPSRVR